MASTCHLFLCACCFWFFLFLFGSGVVCLSILLGTVCFYLCNSLFKIVLLDLFWDEVIFQAMHLNPSDLEFVFGHWHAWIMYIFHIDFVGVFCFGNRFSSSKHNIYIYILGFVIKMKWSQIEKIMFNIPNIIHVVQKNNLKCLNIMYLICVTKIFISEIFVLMCFFSKLFPF